MKRESGDRILRLIALFRFAKAVLLIASGLSALRLVHPGVRAAVARWIEAMPLASQYAMVHRAVAFVTGLSEQRIEALAVAAFLYAALFITEGTGLWMGRLWAEWLTIVATTSFIPFEAFEVVKKATPLRAGVLGANIAIVIYLILRRRRLK